MSANPSIHIDESNGGARDAPPESKFFQFYAVLGGKIGQIIAFHIHLWDWRTLDPPVIHVKVTEDCH